MPDLRCNIPAMFRMRSASFPSKALDEGFNWKYAPQIALMGLTSKALHVFSPSQMHCVNFVNLRFS